VAERAVIVDEEEARLLPASRQLLNDVLTHLARSARDENHGMPRLKAIKDSSELAAVCAGPLPVGCFGTGEK